MTVAKIFFEKDIDNIDLVEIEGESFFYLTKVLRYKKGDTFFIIDSKNYYIAKINSIERYKIISQILEKRPLAPINLKINLYFGLLKGEKNDFVLKTATQLSTYSFHPLITKRTILKINSSDRIKKQERFQRIVNDMARESFLGFIPQVYEIAEIDKKIFEDDELKIVFYEGQDIKLVSDIGEDIKKSKSISLLFGPEGGIDKEELKLLLNKGFIPVSLGDRMLKAEVAIMAGISIVSFIKKGKLL